MDFTQPCKWPSAKHSETALDTQKKKEFLKSFAYFLQVFGIVAMEDILEEIVGDIQDEYDIEEDNITEQDEDEYLVTGETNLEELCEQLGIEFDPEDYENFETLNGLLISKLDRIPVDGETALIEINGYAFEIIEAMNKMIRLVRISKMESDDEEEMKNPEE